MRLMDSTKVERLAKIDAAPIDPKTGKRELSPFEAMMAIGKNIDELVSLRHAVSAATTRFNDAVKAVAEKGKLEPAALKAYVTAKAGDDIEKHQRKVEQLDLLFAERPDEKYHDQRLSGDA